jgi:N-acetylmuramoyl-L-alanine amidase
VKSKFLFLSVCILFCLILGFNQSVRAEELFDVNYDIASKSVIINASKSIKPEVTNVENPPRMVLDFPETIFQPGVKKIDINDENIKQIRISQFKTNPPVARVSIELNKNINFEVRSTIKADRQKIQLSAIEADGPITINNNSLSKIKKPTVIKNDVEAIEYRGSSFLISGKNKIKYEIIKGNEPNIYYLKLPDFSMNGLRDMPVKPGQDIVNIKIDEKNDYSVFTITLKQGLKLGVQSLEANKIEVFSGTNVAVSASDGNLNQISVDFSDNSQTSKLFISSATSTFKYRIFELSNPDRIVIDTFDTTINGFDDPYAEKNSDFIQKVRFGFLDKTQAPGDGVRIVLELKKKVSFKENTTRDKVLELLLYDNESDLALEQGKPVIVLDPGHGGNDPGAIGPNGIAEKNVTLAVSTYVRQMLMDNGIVVIMARSDDSEILLQPRVDIANNNHADLFVSIHCNAMDGTSPIGLETYWRTPQSVNFARVMHRNMVNNLPTNDRGIRKANFFVIHHTVMPSVLLEIGYITNPTEGVALGNPAYQKKIASAIYKGIKDYLNNQVKI